MKANTLRLVMFLCLAGLFVSCATVSGVWPDGSLSPVSGFVPAWTQRFPGVDYAEFHETNPAFSAYCVRVDLGNPAVSIVVTPPEGPSGGYRLARTTTAARRYGLSAAVNATPFSPVSLFEGEPCDLAGLSVSGSVVESPPESPFASIVFYASGHASILTYTDTLQALSSGEKIDCAAGGFFVILRDGAVASGEFVGRSRECRSARSVAGLSADGETFYILVIDGKDGSHSVGATFTEAARWMAAFGADSALMLDGGGSSALAVAGADGVPRLVNIPVQGSVPRVERPVANHIGVVVKRSGE
jgi:hypothetical protein